MPDGYPEAKVLHTRSMVHQIDSGKEREGWGPCTLPCLCQHGINHLKIRWSWSICWNEHGVTSFARSAQTLANRSAKARVLEESRHLEVSYRSFKDSFAPYAVHLYRLE